MTRYNAQKTKALIVSLIPYLDFSNPRNVFQKL